MADPAQLLDAFENRVTRRFRHLRKWARQFPTDCFRVYDRDIPELAFVVDVYGPRALLQQYARVREDVSDDWLEEVAQRTARALGLPRTDVTARVRLKVDRRVEQHERQGGRRTEFEVQESGLRFLVDLETYVDTGLFLDHRPLRSRVRALADGKAVLNLFSYTGSFSVFAAAGGARATTSVDLSNTYLEWARRNFALNGLSGEQHRFEREDVRRWLEMAREAGERFDLIVWIPGILQFEADGRRLRRPARPSSLCCSPAPGCWRRTERSYFSTNLRGFRFEATMPGFDVSDISLKTIPEDFRNQSIHRCWRIARISPV
ncbi:MAG: class I SAM-dependent methyltransferase [Betaproteobacteria bacterium]|nr:class I SAM-dependent methyltransferase [Betaproteobacteria bacterium]